MTASTLLPGDIAQALADLLDGRALNGTNAATVALPWRGLLAQAECALPNTTNVHTEITHALEQLQLTSRELTAIWKDILACKPGEKSRKGRLNLQLLTGAQLRALPPMEHLIEGIMPRTGLGVMYGPSNSFKTFLMLHMCGHIALARKWYGKEVTQGPVLYIAAEGQLGIKERYIAWCKHYNNDQDVANWVFLTRPVYPKSTELMGELYRQVEAVCGGWPSLIVFDTQARCYEGDENSTADMGAHIRALDDLRERTGAMVMLVHHTGWDNSRMRGSSALLAALDVEMRVDKDQLGTVALTCTKMKDAEFFVPWHFTFQKEPDTLSGVLLLAKDNKPAVGSNFNLPEPQITILTAIVAAGADGLGFSAIKMASGVKRDPKLSEYLQSLNGGGFIKAEGEVGSKGRRYVATTKGAIATASNQCVNASEVF